MKKIYKTFISLMFFTMLITNISEAVVLKAGVSLTNQVPQEFYGSWKIYSKINYSNNPKLFNEQTIDFWNFSKINDVISITNPISGANASITIEDVEGNKIKFKHTIKLKNAIMTETPTLTLNGENFFGTDKIVIEKFKHGKKISEDVVIYNITAEKISGYSAETFFSSTK